MRKEKSGYRKFYLPETQASINHSTYDGGAPLVFVTSTETQATLVEFVSISINFSKSVSNRWLANINKTRKEQSTNGKIQSCTNFSYRHFIKFIITSSTTCILY